MREYELGVVLHPDLEIEQDKALAKIEKQITDLKGKVVSRDDWGKRKLAYPIAKQGYGLYCFYRLELDTAAVSELERGLQISNEVMRYLVVKYEAPVAVADKANADKPAETKEAKVTPKREVTKAPVKDKEE